MNLHPAAVGEGLVLVGDSIAVGRDTLAGSIPARPFGLWIAEALGISFTSFATGGYTIARCAAELVPRVQRDYQYACLAVGTNDALSNTRPPDPIVTDVVRSVAARADQTVVLGVNASLRWSASINTQLERASRDAGVTFVRVDLPARLLRPDRVHPTAAGQFELADLAAEALGLGLVPSRVVYPKGLPPQPRTLRFARALAAMRR